MGRNAAGSDAGAGEPPKPAGVPNGIGSGPPPFLSKTYDMVDDPETDAIVSWGPDNNSFVVWNHPEFARDLLPKYFKHNNFSSFVRQLNTYGFRKVDPDRWEFANEDFLRGQKHLLKRINRRKSSNVHSQPPQQQVQTASVGACVEVGKFGLEEEVERLKRDKNVLMQELVRLRQQQQTTDEQLQSLTKRLQGMENRQQQMMSFLAKAMQSPGFLAQFVQQNDNSRRIVGVSKKRRLPKHENSFEDSKTTTDGQIVKYQPLMNEAAKAMLMKILQMDTSPRLEHMNASDNFLLENAPSPDKSIEPASLATRTSGVTLAEVPTSSGNTIPPSNTSIPVFPSPPLSDLQPAAAVPRMDTTTVASSATSDMANIGLLASVSEADVQGQAGTGFPEFSSVEEMVSDEGVVNIPNSGFSVSGTPISGMPTGYPDPISVGLETLDDLEEDSFCADTDMSILLEESSKLPGINDAFWEQFLISSPISGDADDNMAIQDGIENAQAGQDNWDGIQNMDHLTERMGLLTSESDG